MAGKNQQKHEKDSPRHRSPNYPAVGLRDAVERVRALVEKDGKAGAKLDLAAKHIGFSGAHGTARTVLSALRKFGLTADQNGRIVPTQMALDILHFPPDHERSIVAKTTAATSPYIYQQLLEQLGQSGNLPSAESLRAELIADWGFNPKAVDAFLADFLDTLTYAGLLHGNELSLSAKPTSEEPLAAPVAPAEAFTGWSVGHAAPVMQPPQASAQPIVRQPPGKTMRDLTLPLMDNEVALLRVPSPLSEENFDYLMQQLSILKRGLIVRTVGHAVSEAAWGRGDEITLDMRHKLLSLGYKPEDISQMGASQALEIVSSRRVATE